MARSYANGVLTGVAISAGAALLAPLLARWGRPVVKGAIKGGIAAYEVGRGRLAELGETMGDLVAEAQLELATERAAEAPPAETL